jgi:hypothetical protein
MSGHKFDVNGTIQHVGLQHSTCFKLNVSRPSNKLKKAWIFKAGIRQQSALSDNDVFEDFIVR